MSKEQGDRLQKAMMAGTMEWFKADVAKDNVNECTEVEQKIVRQIAKADLSELKAKDLGQTLAYVTKAKDQNARLIQFSAGAADTRTELSLDAILPLLSNEEFAIFQAALVRLQAVQATGELTPLLPN